MVAATTAFTAIGTTPAPDSAAAAPGELPEGGQRRVAGAEVVEGEAHAERVEAVQDRQRAAGVAHDVALGDLEGHLVRRDADAAQFATHQVDDAGVEQVAHRHV